MYQSPSPSSSSQCTNVVPYSISAAMMASTRSCKIIGRRVRQGGRNTTAGPPVTDKAMSNRHRSRLAREATSVSATCSNMKSVSITRVCVQDPHSTHVDVDLVRRQVSASH